MFTRRYASVIIFLAILLALYYLPVSRDTLRQRPWANKPVYKPIVCCGPRGSLLSNSSDDQVIPIDLKIPYPVAPFGSHDELSLSQTWMTADIKYGPYGYGDEREDYNRKKVDWEHVDWGRLQDDCAAQNQDRFGAVANVSSRGRMVPNPGFVWPRPEKATGRTAIVLRGYDTYNYAPEDLLNIRSLIVEAGLSTSGNYAVYLLVHIREKEHEIYMSEANYTAALEKFVPVELRSIAVLFDETLLENWYPKTATHHPNFQIYQPLQLFAYYYPEYDHFWQLELDVRFTGHTAHYLDALNTFARKQPRKQSIERSSYLYIPSIHGTYANFTSLIDATLNGGGVWGAVNIPDVEPVGPKPTGSSQEDDFSWGVGEDADLIATNPCSNVTWTEDWVYRDWIHNFQNGVDTPRIFCAPAITRTSYRLLAAAHDAQADKGLTIPSEATVSSFALWHGLKIVFPPQPMYQNPLRDLKEMDIFFNGGPPNASRGAMAKGDGFYNARPHYDITNTATWWWSSPFPAYIFRNWLDPKENEELPFILHKDAEGRIWAPNLALHPVKTN
ncbi:hypothetical protein BU16DRAFT_557617 [Lophium mytilinum]|uniref:Uncharacterized protein n=1 Tax=Lophium mytilinum TaxID=390894 RepID=A0A6A6R455_9PEZI|nr:hypothetical protein BU16DRAFT_557617 [Lophium mytilinum]